MFSSWPIFMCGVSIPIKEHCWFVCLLFIGHTTFVHFAALPPSTPREQEPSSRAGPRARAQACTARARAHAVQLLNEKIVRWWCLSKTKPYARAHAVVLQFDLGVFTFRIVLNRTWSLVGADLGQLVYIYIHTRMVLTNRFNIFSARLTTQFEQLDYNGQSRISIESKICRFPCSLQNVSLTFLLIAAQFG